MATDNLVRFGEFNCFDRAGGEAGAACRAGDLVDDGVGDAAQPELEFYGALVTTITANATGYAAF